MKGKRVRDERGLSFVESLIVVCVVALLGFAAWRGFGTVLSAEIEEAAGDVSIISACPLVEQRYRLESRRGRLE